MTHDQGLSRAPRSTGRRAAARGTALARPARGGYSLAELFIVMTIMAVLVAIAGPQITAVRERQAVRGARGEVVATIEAARSAAVQRGRPARVLVRGNTVRAVVDDGTASGYLVVATAALDTMYDVQLSTAAPEDTLVFFDGRGLTSPRLIGMARYIVRSRQTAQRDSVCISRLGVLLPRCAT